MTDHTTHFDDRGMLRPCLSSGRKAWLINGRDIIVAKGMDDATARELARRWNTWRQLEAENAHLRSEVERLRTALKGTRDVLDELDPHPESIVGRVLTLVEIALKEADDANGAT